MDETKIRILVIDRGFVCVCRCPDPRGHSLWLSYTDRRTIRQWGTTDGMGQLAAGPTEATVLDALVPAGHVPIRAILDVLEVDQDAWAVHLRKPSSLAVTTPSEPAS